MGVTLARLRARRTPAPLPGRPDDIALYHAHSPATEAAVTDRVWEDLDMSAVFAHVDSCVSAPGQQLLLFMMRRPESDAALLAARARIVEHFADTELDAHVVRALRRLRTTAAYDLPRLFLHEIPARPRISFLFPVLTLSAVAAVLLAFVTPAALIALVIIAVINMWIAAYYRPTVHHMLGPIAALKGLLFAARELGCLQDHRTGDASERLARNAARLSWIDRMSGWIIPGTNTDSIAGMVAAYVNVFLLLDVNALMFGIELIRHHRADLHEVYSDVGTLDALRAVARFRDRLPHWCVPELAVTGKVIRADGIIHPLVENPQPNDLQIDGNGMLITGSNMAGKTTFLRAVGLSALLGHTIATCPARTWRSPPLRVATLIDRSDDVLHGRSYFLVEAETVNDLLGMADGTAQYLFIVDEIFRGTNTRERVAASAAVLTHLNRADHIVMVSTHDHELIDLLPGSAASRGGWEFHHFSETIKDAGASFDYTLRPGVSSAPNALRLLAATGYPDEVVDAALRTYEKMGREGKFPGVDSNHH